MGEDLDQGFENALLYTKQQEPRDVMGYLIAGFRKGYLAQRDLIGV